jgi:acetyltransferase
VGGVALNIRTEEDLRAAFEGMMRLSAAEGVASEDGLKPLTTQHPALSTQVQGAYVQRMVKGQAELLVGVTRDPQFGPLVGVGIGGTQVELKRDVAFDLAPLSEKLAGDLLDRTSAGKLLAGFRGAPPADRAAAVDVILRLSQIAIDWPQIQEIEVNPLIVMGQGEGAVAVDARVRVAGS